MIQAVAMQIYRGTQPEIQFHKCHVNVILNSEKNIAYEQQQRKLRLRQNLVCLQFQMYTAHSML